MCSIYQMQFSILHAKLMIIGLWTTLYTTLAWGSVSSGKGEELVKQIYIYAIPLNYLILLYSIFMLKGVSIKNIYLIMIINLLIIYIF